MAYPQYAGQTNKVHNTGNLIYGGDGTNFYPISVDSNGYLQIELLAGTASFGALSAGTARIGKVQPDMHEVRVVKAIDASIGAYAAGDMINDDDCCTTATPWQLTGAANANGGYGVIWNIKLINETENQAVRYRIIMFNATPVGSGTDAEFTDNTPNMHPHKGDRAKYLGEIAFPSSIARGAAIATYTQASPSTTGDLPLYYKCASGSTTLPFVLVTDTIYTQSATDDIEIIFEIEHLNVA